MLQVKPIEESSAHDYNVEEWFGNVKRYQFGTQEARCCVLGSLFQGRDYDVDMTLVAEHLIPRRQATVAAMVDIDVYHGRNGVVLCKHLERLLQAGLWSLVPVSCGPDDMLSCRIHVADTELEMELQDIDSADSERRPLLVRFVDGMSTPLKMKHLHGQLVTIQKPYIRSLLLKNLMASKKNLELPNPLHASRLPSYISWCDSIERFNLHMVLAAGEGSEKQEAQPEVAFNLHPPQWIGGQLCVGPAPRRMWRPRQRQQVGLAPE